MTTLTRVIRNCYRDSLSLMQLSARVSETAGVDATAVVMATDGNQELLRDAGLLAGEADGGANDILVVIRGEDTRVLEAAFAGLAEELNREPPASRGVGRTEAILPRSLAMSLREASANLALISVPGEYAAAEAFKALRLGLHVMLFSAGVAQADEVTLKEYAGANGLLVMGPDCGTAIINGVPLGFANVVRRGDIGCVGASGTGLQEVTTLIHRHGGGVSQVIGTGGRDLSGAVGGLSTLQALEALARDPETRVIVVVSKPPDPEVTALVVERAGRAGKPVVVNFLGADPETGAAGVVAARTLEEAAGRAVALSQGVPYSPNAAPSHGTGMKERNPRTGTARGPGQRYIRGLYSGGTLAAEAVMVLREAVDPVYSNTSMPPALDDIWKSQGHAVVDLGDARLTRGRPHPMIDPRMRAERILGEADDPEVAVIVLDVVLGYGAHDDPAGALAPVIREARHTAERAGRSISFVASVCGTPDDPQDASRQERTLHAAGVVLGRSNAEAARIALELARGGRQGNHD
ncbi:MAG: acyl-CoA synthetase FdrA [Deltaproteobacteria bacterium]|nr:acyl-CoA synthetase FdrA [Deltaproteobacteria bacterium]